ncbi:MAG: SMP-30/Gluconolaconase/LRE domain protein [Cyanobacteria bacterium RYN_339]|nr:SMP-30/Gluconolaconase/LRE domain protein [Cyanobacteria bacterium RYN_339]
MRRTPWGPLAAGLGLALALAAGVGADPLRAWLAVAFAVLAGGYMYGVVVQHALARPAIWRPVTPGFYLPFVLLLLAGGGVLALPSLFIPARSLVHDTFPVLITGGDLTMLAFVVALPLIGGLYGFYMLADGLAPGRAFSTSWDSIRRRGAGLMMLLILPPLACLVDPSFNGETLAVLDPQALGLAAAAALAAAAPLSWLLARNYAQVRSTPAPAPPSGRLRWAWSATLPIMVAASWYGGAFGEVVPRPAVDAAPVLANVEVTTEPGWEALKGPWGLAAGPDGTLYVGEPWANQILVKRPGQPAATLAAGNRSMGARAMTLDPLGRPRELALGPDGALYATSYIQAAVMRIAAGGEPRLLAGGWWGRRDGVGEGAHFHQPSGLAFGPSGDLFVADAVNDRIRRIDPNGVVTTFAGGRKGLADGQGTAARFDHPQGLAFGPAGELYVADGNNDCIRKIAPDGVVTTLAGQAGPGLHDGRYAEARFRGPTSVAVGPGGDVYVVESGPGRLRKLSPAGVVTTLVDKGLEGPVGVAALPDGRIYVADFGHGRLAVVRERR